MANPTEQKYKRFSRETRENKLTSSITVSETLVLHITPVPVIPSSPSPWEVLEGEFYTI